jgi:soluble lytic murein transglycosylase
MVQRRILALTAIAVLLSLAPSTRAQQSLAPAGPAVTLKPTNHPRVPADESQLWLAPTPASRREATDAKEFATAVKLEVDSDFAKALSVVSKGWLQQGTLGLYAIYYQGFAELRLGRAADARRTFQTLRSREPVGYLAEAAALREAECDEALGENQAAVAIYERLTHIKTVTPDEVMIKLGRAARAAGNLDKATEAFSRVVYEFPFSDLAAQASAELESLPIAPVAPGSNRYKLELGRAERLFGARRYAQARQAFEGLRTMAQGDDRELVALRLAESDYFLKRARSARDGVKPFVDKASRQGEALFFYAVAERDLGDTDEYLRTVRRVVQEFPEQSWAEEALNNLATHYILQNDDAQADATFREMYEKFPTGRYGERAAWKIGWWAYKNGRYADTVSAFESGAANFPRSDYRPSWLYWSARAHEALGDNDLARARYTLVTTDYLNTYYGRLATARLGPSTPLGAGVRAPERRLVVDTQTDPSTALGARAPAIESDGDDAIVAAPPPPNASIIRALLSQELYDQALDELRYAQRVWGDSSAIQATLGWIYHQRGDLRAGINAIKRAYPQYMAAGGERLPSAILKVLFPVNYWALIRRYSAERQLDPYMIAALVAQESTFTADARSSANAYGLMQLVPATGRQYARTLHLPKRFSIGMLTTAETNIRMGTAYFADLVRQFGGVHYALATYNAGPNRVARWISERPGVDREEFIDDIPFPETQGYVKKILGTAEDYRRLYGAGAPAADEADAAPAVAKAAARPGAKPAGPAAKKPAAKAPAKKKTTARKTKKTA